MKTEKVYNSKKTRALWSLIGKKHENSNRCHRLLIEGVNPDGLFGNWEDDHAIHDLPLTVAIDKGFNKIAKLLIEYGADPDGEYRKSSKSKVPLIEALKSKEPDYELCSILVAEGAELEAVEVENCGNNRKNVFEAALCAAENGEHEWKVFLNTLIYIGIKRRTCPKNWDSIHGSWKSLGVNFSVQELSPFLPKNGTIDYDVVGDHHWDWISKESAISAFRQNPICPDCNSDLDLEDWVVCCPHCDWVDHSYDLNCGGISDHVFGFRESDEEEKVNIWKVAECKLCNVIYNC